MTEFFTSYIWPVIVIVAQSLLLLVILLIAIAYVLYADRKIWAAVQMRRGPNVVRPFGLLQSFADLLKFVLKEPVIPAGRQQGRVPAAAPSFMRVGPGPLDHYPRQCRRGQCPTSMSGIPLILRGGPSPGGFYGNQ